ncbi:NADPH-dependent FMN reductase [Streptomyces fimicarius]|uniref:NAD(P)H-dependent oxidoreductase n=2 Tax=Streptomyces TaxID=1883 RepID=A0AB33KEY8_9ACTN|nr:MULTISPECIES: NAD(P)H-dependent oxidoreductase [Streptomyces]MCL6291351.1 NAD(P)H-dependent oxidoreductase [Streptomyces sp. 43Y-GA-1]MDX2669849.1 NAD(P)H-dependent oxidoreductase [Streptomyces sp. NRRL_ISP-5395]MDX3336748.1 NAD(P)H-dependent oxidoreductase [Streptomyces sp. ME02-6979.5a]MDX3501039.1 NAD(P)H-dependent oxidoreductase [Streptomyces sp. ATCC51928]MDX3591247.1 NAD(P)H-dependent oxidoreductase [Streptomyces sp. ID03-2B]
MSQNPLKIGVLIGSVRTGRFADKIAQWFISEISQRENLEIHVIDLSEPALVEELKLSLDALEPADGAPCLAQRIGGLDGFVIITPEYNHGYPASLKLAIDYVYNEWRAKPVGFVSYGGMAGGHRAVEQLRQVFAEMHAVTLRDTVSFHMAWEKFDESGQPLDAAGASKASAVLLDQLTWWGLTLREGRAARPYEG